MDRTRCSNVAITLWLMATSAVAGAPAQGSEATMTDAAPVLLFIQGRLNPGAEATYGRYLAGTRPLMAKYGAEVTAVGAGLESEHTTDDWPVNAVLSFPDRAAAEAFLSDPSYLEIRPLRDQAYETLHLTLVQSRAPKVRTAREIALEAFEDFRHGLASGDWQGFLARLSDDFTLRFPMGLYQGEHRGRDKAAEFFGYVSSAFPGGLTIDEVERITAEGQQVVFEFRDHGELRGQPYRNIVAISLDVCGNLICGYREYFGLVGPPPVAKEGNGP